MMSLELLQEEECWLKSVDENKRFEEQIHNRQLENNLDLMHKRFVVRFDR